MPGLAADLFLSEFNFTFNFSSKNVMNDTASSKSKLMLNH